MWGLTGGIASGKSTAARFFEKAGIPVIDADQIARKLTSPGGAAYDLILKHFGTTDRAELRKIIFSNPEAKADLERILHPLIQKESLLQITALKAPVVLYEAALLVETGRYADFRGLIVVRTPREQRIERLVTRDHCTPEFAEQILQSQLSDEKRVGVASFILDNSGTLNQLESQVLDLAQKLRP